MSAFIASGTKWEHAREDDIQFFGPTLSQASQALEEIPVDTFAGRVRIE
jgi:hypothetical protein